MAQVAPPHGAALLLLADGRFPAGGYAHSGGLEPVIGVGLKAVDGPVRVVTAVGDAFAAMDDALAAFALPRLRAIAHLRGEDWSYDRIALATNLSKGRVAQLVRDARERGL